MEYLIMGASGQLGQEFCRQLGDRALPLPRRNLDITSLSVGDGNSDTASLPALLYWHRPRFIINCAAYNQVDQAESHTAQAYAVNARAVAELARLSAVQGCTLVHFSTNYVFGQQRGRTRPYAESDTPGPVNAYGRSKLEGERLLQELAPRHFIIRTAGVFGPRSPQPHNFIDTILSLARAGQRLRVVNDQWYTPTCTRDLVSATLHLLSTDAYGLHHLTNAGMCTWHTCARMALARARIDVPVDAISSKESRRPAQRPRHAVLVSSRLEHLGIPPLRSWQDAVSEYAEATQNTIAARAA